MIGERHKRRELLGSKSMVILIMNAVVIELVWGCLDERRLRLRLRAL